jgi:hypothetical protein
MPGILPALIVAVVLFAVGVMCWAAALVDNSHEPDRADEETVR